MNEKITGKYNQMWVAFQEGHITTHEWQTFCETVLYWLIWENEDVFRRLKNI